MDWRLSTQAILNDLDKACFANILKTHILFLFLLLLLLRVAWMNEAKQDGEIRWANVALSEVLSITTKTDQFYSTIKKSAWWDKKRTTSPLAAGTLTIEVEERIGLQDMDIKLFFGALSESLLAERPVEDSASLDWELERAKGSQVGEQQPISAIRLSSSSARGAPLEDDRPDISSPPSLIEEERPERSIVLVLLSLPPQSLQASKKAERAAGWRIAKLWLLLLLNNCREEKSGKEQSMRAKWQCICTGQSPVWTEEKSQYLLSSFHSPNIVSFCKQAER